MLGQVCTFQAFDLGRDGPRSGNCDGEGYGTL